MTVRNYLVMIALILGALLVNLKPMSIDLTFLADTNTIVFILVLFIISARFDLVKFDTLHSKSMKMTALYMAACAFILTGFMMMFKLPIFESVIFSVMVCGTVSYAALKKKKLSGIMEAESDLSTPLAISIAYILIAVYRSRAVSEFGLSLQIFTAVKEIIIGIGVGVVFGLVVYFFLRKHFTKMKMLIAVGSAFFAYLVADSLEGNGFLAVIMVGLFFGHFFYHNRTVLEDFFQNIVVFVEMIAFFFVGYLLGFPWNIIFFIMTVVLFAIFLLIRFSCIAVVHKEKPKDVLKLTLLPTISPAVIPLAIIFMMGGSFVFMLIAYLLFGFVIYSTLVSIVAQRVWKS